jgi:hypothetical protein
MKTPGPYRFRLYVAGSAENSLAAIANLRIICQRCLPELHEVELVDVLALRSMSARHLSKQLLRSATSVGANLEEADAAQSRADFI